MRFLFLFLALGVDGLLRAEVALHQLFRDGVVLQREQAVTVWGTAAAGENVSVEFAGQSLDSVADAKGHWRVTLAPLAASSESRELVARASNTITVRDVVVGDVWLASGQSNMGWPLASGATAAALPTANDTLLRIYNVPHAVAAEPSAEVDGKWEPTTPANARTFSAVAYFVARELRRTQGVPIGVLHASWGGTPIQTWMSLESIRREPAIPRMVTSWDTAHARHLVVKDQPELMSAYYTDIKDWLEKVKPVHLAAIAAHDKAMSAARAAGQPTVPAPKPSRPEPVQPDPLAMPAKGKFPSTPGIAYNAMIAPLAPFALRGALWYQGESDGTRGAEYRDSFPRLIESWRELWHRPDLPFLFVQLPGCYKDGEKVSTKGWAFTREAQLLTLRLPQTGMAVTIDIGDPTDVHPQNKEHVAARLALLARRLAYGENIAASGPLYKSHAREGEAIRLRFTETADGLKIGESPWRAKGVAPAPTDRLVGFYIAGEEGKWVEANAAIEGDTLLVSAASVPAPVAVRYAWAAFPQANLANGAGLPASPFRTDE